MLGKKESYLGFKLETVTGILTACEWDLEREEDRMRGIDSKLTQLAAFSGLSISISGAIGGSVLAAGRLAPGFLIALGSCIFVGAVLLLAGVVVSFRALSPKLYRGVDESAVAARTTKGGFRRSPEEALSKVAVARKDALVEARKINDKKAESVTLGYKLVTFGFAALVLGLLVTSVASVV